MNKGGGHNSESLSDSTGAYKDAGYHDLAYHMR